MLATYGASMAWDVWDRGFGGNEASAVIVVLVLFLGGGGLLTGMSAFTLFQLLRDRRDRRSSPVLRA